MHLQKDMSVVYDLLYYSYILLPTVFGIWGALQLSDFGGYKVGASHYYVLSWRVSTEHHETKAREARPMPTKAASTSWGTMECAKSGP